MKTLIKLGLGIGIVILLFILYPFYTQYVGVFYSLNIIIFNTVGRIPSPLELLFFNALPLIGLILILWIGYKIITGWRI